MAPLTRQRPKVFGTGVITLDLIIGVDPDVPVRAWTGGTCGNVLSILAMLGWDAYPIARMNRDPASQQIPADMKKWGVRRKFASCRPTTDTPINIQHIRRRLDGSPKHWFSWTCPQCGSRLPGFKPVTRNAAYRVSKHMGDAAVFFMDRVSRSALLLAERAAKNGAVVVFEPTAKSDERLLGQALNIAHIIKYSSDHFKSMPGAMQQRCATLVEVQTFGGDGLRYRHRLGRTVSTWKQLASVPAAHLADTCGSGDWCTAGLIAMIAANGQHGLLEGGPEGLAEALKVGQRLAAWNVGFEGARGGMYAMERSKLEKHIRALVFGESEEMQPPARRK